MKTPLLLIAALAVLPLTNAAAPVAEPAQPIAVRRAPNIVFLIVDDFRRHTLNFTSQGRDENGLPLSLSPNLDRLAREGTVLQGMHSVAPLCNPSRFSCLTGLYPSRATSTQNQRALKEWGQTHVVQGARITADTVTLPRILRERGYVTAAFGKDHVMDTPEWTRPPKDADPRDPKIRAWLEQSHRALQEGFYRGGFDRAERLHAENLTESLPLALVSHNLDWEIEGALAFIDQHADRPFFLYLATGLTHGPHSPYAWREGDPLDTPLGFLEQAPTVLPPRGSIPERLKAGGFPPDRGDVLWYDDAVGALLRRLEERGVLENTIIVFINDHGMGDKGSLYQGGMQTEAFIWAPHRGVIRGRRADALCANIDLAPTLLDLAGVDPQKFAFDGRSLRDVLTGKTDRHRDYLYGEMGLSRGLRLGDWKYIAFREPAAIRNLTREQRQALIDEVNAYRMSIGEQKLYQRTPDMPFGIYAEFPGGSSNVAGPASRHRHYFDGDQLYNLVDDPGEQVNLAYDPRHTERLETMRQNLQAEIARLPGAYRVWPGPEDFGARENPHWGKKP